MPALVQRRDFRIDELNPLEEEVLLFLSKGLHNAEIGAYMGLSERAVRYHLSKLFVMFHVTNRTELVGRLAAGDLGFVPAGRTGPREPAPSTAVNRG